MSEEKKSSPFNIPDLLLHSCIILGSSVVPKHTSVHIYTCTILQQSKSLTPKRIKVHLNVTRSLTRAGSALAHDGCWRNEYEANVLEEPCSGRADGCARMVRRLYCVKADAHGLNSESESN